MKLAYIIEGLYNSGGMERIITQKANWFVSEANVDVTIITFAQRDSQKDFFHLREQVKRIRLHSAFETNMMQQLSHDLSQCINDNKYDICISTYGREFKILPLLKIDCKIIVEFHFAYDIHKNWLSNSCGKIKTELLGTLKTWLMVHQSKKFDKVVCLTKADEKKWNSNKVIQIYNPLTFVSEEISDCRSKIVVALGRMDYLKGFDYLIDCWSLLENKYPDWQLHIYGGGDASLYKKQSDTLGLKNVHFKGLTNDVKSVYLGSSIFVMSSRTEGFPLAMCEAMTCGLPIVSFDCPSGPAELIADGVNGFLIDQVGDCDSMADKMSLLMDSFNLRCKMGKESKRMSVRLQEDAVMHQWINLFKQIMS